MGVISSRRIVKRDMELAQGALTGHITFRNTGANSTSRVYVEPNGDPVGVKSAVKMFFEQYSSDLNNYRDVGLYTDETDRGPNGAGMFLINSKVNADWFGAWPTIGISSQDGNEIPLRVARLNWTVPDINRAAWATALTGNWRTNKVYAIGNIVCASVGKLYQATTAGTSGATKPVHAAGAVSDGGVTWQFLFDYAALVGADFAPLVAIGNKTDAINLSTDVSLRAVRLHLTQPVGLYSAKPLNFYSSSGIKVGELVESSGDTYWRNGASTAGLRLSNGVNPFVQLVGTAFLHAPKSITTNGTAVDVSGCSLINFGNTLPTTVAQFTFGTQNQEITIMSGNGQTTIAHNANIILNGGVAKTLTANSCLRLVANTAGTVFKEVGTL
jgi:hypothetical protein